MTVVGEASVIVRALGDKVKGDIEKSFKDARPAVSAAGDQAGATFSDRIGKAVSDRAGDIYAPLEDQADESGGRAGSTFIERIRERIADASDRVYERLEQAAQASATRSSATMRRELESIDFSGLSIDNEAVLRQRALNGEIELTATRTLEAMRLDRENARERERIIEERIAQIKAVEVEERRAHDLSVKRIEALRTQGSRTLRSIAKAGLKLSILTPIIGVLVGGLSNLIAGVGVFAAGLAQASSSAVALSTTLTALIGGLLTTVIAFNGVGDAIKAGLDPEKAEEFAEAMKGLSPAAQGFVEKVIDLRGEFKSLRDSAATGLFPGLTEALGTLATKTFPTLRNVLRETGEAMGDVARSLAGSFSTPTFLTNLNDVGSQNAEVLRTLGAALGDAAAAFIALTDASSSVTQRFADWVAKGAESARISAEAGNQAGTLGTRLNKAGDIAALIGDIIGNLSEGIYDLGVAAGPTGTNLLRAFNRAAEGMANYTDKQENVDRLDDYFGKTETNFLAISSMLKELGAAFLRLGENPGVGKAAEAIEDIIPSLERALEAGTNNIPKIVKVVGTLLEIFADISESFVVTAVVNVFDALATALKAVIEAPVLGFLAKLALAMGVLVAVMTRVAGVGAKLFGVRGVMTLMSAGRAFKTGGIEGMALALDKTDKAGRRAGDGVRYFGAAAGGAHRGVSRLGQTIAPVGSAFASFGRGAREGFEEAARGADGAITRMDRVRAAGRGLLRVGPTVAAVGVLASGAADKVGLSNTAMLTAAGSIAGPWGAAAGAVAGFTMDIVSRNKQVAEEAAKLRGETERIVKFGSSSEQSSALIANQEKLAKLREDLAKRNDDSGATQLARGVGLFGGNKGAIEKEIKAAEKAGRDIKAAFERGTSDINVKIGFEQAVDDFGAFVKDVQANAKGGLTLDIKTQVGRDTFAQISNLGAAANAAGGPAIDQFRNKVTALAGDLGITSTAATILANKAAGLGASVAGLPPGKTIKIDAKTEDALRKAGFTSKEIQKIKDKSIKVNAETDRARQKAKDVEKYINGRSGSIDVTANTDRAKASVSSFRTSKLFNPIQQVINVIRNVTEKKKASGGLIVGPGTGTSDSISTALSNGEYVIRASQTAKHRQLLDAINSGAQLDGLLPERVQPTYVQAGPGGGGRSSGMARIAGTLDLTDRSTVVLNGFAEEAYDSNASYDDLVRGMG